MQTITFRTDKEDVVHIYNGLLLSHKKEWNNAICSNMDATRDSHTKWSKSERERQIPCDITYMWNLEYDINGSTKQKQTQGQGEQTFGYQRGRGEIMKITLLYTWS